MSNVASPLSVADLGRIFYKPAVVEGETVKITLDKGLTAEQFALLAEFSQRLDVFPSIMRSGAGVSIRFA